MQGWKMKREFRFWICLALTALILSAFGCSNETPKSEGPKAATITVTDALGRAVQVPEKAARVICSGPGCLRYLTYLQAQDRAVAVDNIELRKTRIDARPYAMANPEFDRLPMFGEFRGHDNPELIAALEPQPQVIFKTYAKMGHDPVELQTKTGIPVVVLDYGDLGHRRAAMDASLRLMGKVLGVDDRAEAVIGFFDRTVADLEKRAASVAEQDRPTCYVGGIAFKGPHGFQSTEPGYPPFLFLNARNVAAPAPGQALTEHADVAKEKLLEWNPETVFVDLSTIRAGATANSLHELATDPAYQHLAARKTGRIYGVLPYNWYTSNHGSTLADAYFIGTVLYPEAFKGVDPVTKADYIYRFLVGKPVFEGMNKAFGSLAFQRLDPDKVRIGDKAEILAR